MRVPYKYPYLSIFIIGYYLLEHEGYYYRIKEFFGYSDNEAISYVVELNLDNIGMRTKAPGRKAVVYAYQQYQEEEIKTFAKIARKYKEKLRSPLVFGEIQCTEEIEICKSADKPFLAFVNEGVVTKISKGVIEKKKVKNLIKDK